MLSFLACSKIEKSLHGAAAELSTDRVDPRVGSRFLEISGFFGGFVRVGSGQGSGGSGRVSKNGPVDNSA
jgi:hypothetical protein